MAEQSLADKPDLIRVEHLTKHFPVRGGILQREIARVQAVDDVSFTIKQGETLGMVGKSGCGKTTIGRTILRLTEPTSGKMEFAGKDVFALNAGELKDIRRNMQIIFQDPSPHLIPASPLANRSWKV